MTTTREHGIRIGVQQIITYATLVPILWFIGKPLMIGAMASDIEQIVEKSAAPMQNAFVVLLLRDINALKREIARDEFRAGTEEWTAEDSVRLADKKIELQALQEALGKLQEEGE